MLVLKLLIRGCTAIMTRPIVIGKEQVKNYISVMDIKRMKVTSQVIVDAQLETDATHGMRGGVTGRDTKEPHLLRFRGEQRKFIIIWDLSRIWSLINDW